VLLLCVGEFAAGRLLARGEVPEPLYSRVGLTPLAVVPRERCLRDG